jgi:hypothetical protein
MDGFVTGLGWLEAYQKTLKSKGAAAPDPLQPKKKRGRPPGSKNKRKLEEEDSE